MNDSIQIAESAVAEAAALLKKCGEEESWGWAMNEMSGWVNDDFGKAIEILYSIPKRLLESISTNP